MSQVQLNRDTENLGKPILEVENLAVTFEKTVGTFRRRKTTIKAVDNLSFKLYESEFFAIVGESGSGKTTVARCIMKVAKADSGSIKYNGTEIANLKGKSLHKFRQEVQIVFQDPFESLNPRLDVFNTVANPIRYLTGEKSKEKLVEVVSNLLDEVGLIPEEILHRFPHQLSGGQRQRVNVARALGPNPKLLIADEPITMLDAAQRLNLLSLLVDLKAKRKLTVLMITHDLASAKLTSNRIMVMYLGKLFEYGPADVLLSKPHHPYVELILSSTARPRHDVSHSAPNVPSPFPMTKSFSWIEESERVKQGCIFRPRCRYATDICADLEPPLEEKSKYHYAACHNPLNL